MSVSLIATVFNEEKSIKYFLDTILSMTKIPDEIVIVDAGSKDDTIKIINEYSSKCSFIKLIVKEKCNIAEGRNIAIENATNDIIAVTDAGCKIDEKWLENITAPFSKYKDIDVVSGWYEYISMNKFQDISGELIFMKLDEIDESEFLPSSRSIAFTKSIWEKANGYPEYLTFAGEDTLFDKKLKKIGAKFYFEKDAIVYWYPREDMRSFIKQSYLYAVGDGEAGNSDKYYFKIMLIYALIMADFIILKFSLISWIINAILIFIRSKRIFKLRKKYIINFLGLYLVMDMAKIYGFIKGILRRTEMNKNKYF